jgi:dimethylaniline monooxygenase (N-oxide forming)
MSSSSKRVAVIGAGPAGLATLKELLAEGHEPIGFERAATLGGVFRFHESDGIVWDSCRLTSSPAITAFSDFPVSPDGTHMKVGEYADYLSRYADAFDVRRHIRFSTTVHDLRPAAGGGWKVDSAAEDGIRREEHFDAVAVCSGLHQNPFIPVFPGQDDFPGAVIHGSRYRRPDQVRGQRVLVVGGGESAADIVAEVSEHAADTVLSLRRGVAVVPRIRHGRPNDYRVCRINHTPAPWIGQTRNPRDDWKRRIHTMAFLPFVVFDRFAQAFFFRILDQVRLFTPTRLLSGRQGAGEIRAALQAQKVVARLLEESGGEIIEQFGTKSDDFIKKIVEGKIRRAPQIERFAGSTVHFEDGTTFEADMVIFCTGFEIRVPFLDDAITRERRFLHAFNPAIGPSLGFIGFVRPGHGAIPPLAELQARWFAQLTSEKITLPPEADMRAAILRMVEHRQRFFRAVQGRLNHLVDFTSFCDALASQIGCKPSRAALARESFRFRLHFFASPFVSAQYRLVGPHAKPEMAREVISRLPIVYPLPMLVAFYLRWISSRILHRVLGTEFAPKLELQPD